MRYSTWTPGGLTRQLRGRLAGAAPSHDLGSPHRLQLGFEKMYHGSTKIVQRETAPMANRGTIVNVVSWLLLVLSMCTLVARFCMKLSIKNHAKRFGLDDLFIVIAAVFSIGHTVTASIESMQVLGPRIDDLNPSEFVAFRKAEWAGCMLYIANMGCARVSICLLIKKVLPGILPNTAALVFSIFTLLWGVSGILVTAFMCSLPGPWLFLEFLDGKKCIDIVKWVNYLSITNIVTEVLLISIPLVLWNLRTSAGKRFSVSFAFMARLSIVAAVSIQLYYFNRYTLEFTEYWRVVLCVQIAQNLSIITASLPCLSPFIIKILAGSVQTENIRFRGTQKFTMCGLIPPKNNGSKQNEGKISYDPMSSQSSALVNSDGEKKKASDYCRPLATYGLDRSSAHLNSQHFNRFPSNSTIQIADPESPPPKDVFMAPVAIPTYRPTIPHSGNGSQNASHSRNPSKTRAHSRTPSDIPQNLSDVGVLPLIEWDSDSSDPGSGRSSLTRRPDSTYIFNRSKVISVPEESHLREGENQDEYYKKYYPPLPSPKLPPKK
ncbi:unnamed protein product [Periconia digitata]|uniref:Rhodopsin domain-containing protein n=1 Tax=Periconia digitata TaxID=1303443 RepID=A0A9W4U9Q2_9PLEO|nr:unnamed protein product [Periconia digitata]